MPFRAFPYQFFTMALLYAATWVKQMVQQDNRLFRAVEMSQAAVAWLRRMSDTVLTSDRYCCASGTFMVIISTV